MNNKPSVRVGSEVSFVGTFGMRRFTTRSGKVISVDDETKPTILVVQTPQGKHTKHLHEVSVRTY